MPALNAPLAAVLIAAALGAAAPPGKAAGAGPARTRTEALIESFKKVPPASATPTGTQRAARGPQYEALDGFLDLDHMVDAAIAPSASRLDAAQLARFKRRFRELIRLVAYPNSGDFFRKAELSLQPEREAEAGVTAVAVKVRLAEEDLDTEVEFHWRAGAGGELRVVDVVFEGDSMVRDYQNQIARVIAKSGPGGLLEVLDERYAELVGTAKR
jgi:ABC-type transporter MlaC component